MKLHKELQERHFKWFKAKLVENGAPEEIKDAHVRASCGYFDSERAFIAGYLEAKTEKVCIFSHPYSKRRMEKA